eukprot:892581-Alexandrium_andersonii.AAC.1
MTGRPRLQAACLMVSMTLALVGGAPKAFGNSGADAGFSEVHCVQAAWTRCLCLMTLHAGHMPWGIAAGAL